MSGPELIVIATDAPAGAAFTTRRGGASAGPFASLNLGAERGDADADVRANRARVCEELGLDGAAVAMLNQVHGTTVRRAGEADGRFLDALRGWPDGDVLTGDASTGALAVLGADCLPVLLWRRDRPAVAAAHAGWRGLVAGVVEEAVAAIGAPERVAAAVGPGIGPCCYPVSAEVRERFASRFGAGVVTAPGGQPGGRRARGAGGRGGAGGRDPDRGGVHLLRRRALLLVSPRRRRERAPGGPRLGDRPGGGGGPVIDPDALRAVLAEARERLDEAAGRSGRPPGSVELVLAGKYVPAEDTPALVAAGVTVVGENRLQDLQAKSALAEGRLTFDFIGHLQRRKVRDVLAATRLIHSVELAAPGGGDRLPRGRSDAGSRRSERRRGANQRWYRAAPTSGVRG